MIINQSNHPRPFDNIKRFFMTRLRHVRDNFPVAAAIVLAAGLKMRMAWAIMQITVVLYSAIEQMKG